MGKHYETLAVIKDREAASDKIVKEGINTFSKKADHFLGATRTLKMFDAAKEHEEAAAREVKILTSTVDEKLEHVNEAQITYLDALGSKERTNQLAKADVIVDGKVIMRDMPAALLLAYEKYFASEVRDLYNAIPTLQPGVEWVEDTQNRAGVFKAKELIVKHKSEKTFQHKVLVEPTPHHPAQIEKWTADVPIGNFTESRVSGMLTTREKADRIKRLEKLVAALKTARSRANDLTALDSKDGAAAFDYINAGNFPS